MLVNSEHLHAVLKLYGERGGRVPPSRFSVPHRDLGVPPSRFERWIIRRKRARQHEEILQIPAEYSLKLRGKLISREKPFQLSAKTFFCNLHSISATESSLKYLVKAAKASPHAKFYNLSTAYMHAEFVFP